MKEHVQAGDMDENLLIPDSPITSRKQDRLGMSESAKSLAETLFTAIDNGALEQGSFVCAIDSAWGQGKTSFVNMLTESLKEIMQDRFKVSILRYDPWSFPDVNYSTHFFQEFSMATGKIPARLRTVFTKIGRTTAKYHKILESIALLWPGALGVLVIYYLDQLLVQPVIPTWVALIFLTIASLSVCARILGISWSVLNEFRDEPFSDKQETLKAALKKMSKKNRTVVIVIDDLDRLSSAQILRVLQFLKGNADLPNITFILCLDFIQVCNAKEIQDHGGSRFLEKFIQLRYPLPSLTRSHIITLSQKYILQPLVQLKGWDERLLTTDLLNSFANRAIFPLLLNFRDIKRLHNSSISRLNALQSENFLEVHPADFLGMEAISAFAPSLFARLPALSDLLIGPTGFLAEMSEMDGSPSATLKSQYNELLSLAKVGFEREEFILEIIDTLFPRVKNVRSNRSPRESINTAIEETFLRISAREVFFSYLTLNPKSHKISETDLKKYYNDITSKLLSIKEILNTPSSDFYFTWVKILRKVEHRFYEEPHSDGVEFLIRNVFAASDHLPQNKTVWDYEAFLLYWFQLIKDLDQRNKLLINLVQARTNLFASVVICYRYERENVKDNETSDVFSEEVYNKCKSSLIDQLKVINMVELVGSHSQCIRILWYVKKVFPEHEFKTKIESVLNNSDAACSLLKRFVSNDVEYDVSGVKLGRRVNFAHESLAELVGAPALSQLRRAAENGCLEGEERRVVLSILK